MLACNYLANSIKLFHFFFREKYPPEEKFKHEKDVSLFEFMQKKKTFNFFLDKNPEYFDFFLGGNNKIEHETRSQTMFIGEFFFFSGKTQFFVV